MSAVTLSIIADQIGLGLADDGHPYNLGDDADGTAYDLQNIHVGMDGEHSANGVGGNDVACVHCNTTYPDQDDADSDTACTGNPCPVCESVTLGDDGDDCETCEGTGCGPHDWQPLPVSWCNSLGVRVDRDKDSVSVHISVGDPRGNFFMTIRKRPDTGQLLLHVPYADMPAPHVPLRELHPGTFALGS